MIKFLRFVPVQITFFLIIGILVGNSIYFNPIYLIGLLAILIVFLLFFHFFINKYFGNSSFIFTVTVFLLTFLIGITSINFRSPVALKRHYSNLKDFNVEKNYTSVLKIRKELKSNKKYFKYETIVLQIENKKVTGKILINIEKDSLTNQWQVDDEFLINTQFREIPKLLNPSGFDYKMYLKNQQIYHQAFIGKKELFKTDSSNSTIYGLAAKIRANINTSLIKNGFKNDELALINALLLGQRQTISEDLLDDYKDAGAIHILAVSGLHIGIILLLLVFLFKGLHSFKNGKLIATILIISLLWFYAIIAGLSASVVRAVAMFTSLSIGIHLNKPSNIYNNLVISMFFLLLFYPFYLFEIGFQLSYIAVFSIVWIQPKLYDLWISEFWIFRKMWQLFTVSIAAQLGILPLSLFYFHQFPGLFFVANMLIIPFLGFILISGIVIIVLSLVGILPQFLAEFYSVILKGMNGIITWVSSMDYFIIRNITLSLILMLGSYFVIVATLKWLEKQYYSRLILVFISVLFVQSVFIFEKFHRQFKKELIVFNNFKETSIGIRTGEKIVLNTSKSNSITTSYLVKSGIKKIDSFKENNQVFKFEKDILLVVDSLGIYNFKSIKPTIIILKQSPKINLDRLIKTVKPNLIIADATNYKSYLKRWEQTCVKNKTPFYNTMQKGAFILK